MELRDGELYAFELESFNGLSSFRYAANIEKSSPHVLIIGDIYSDMRDLLWEQSIDIITISGQRNPEEPEGEVVIVNSTDSLISAIDRIMDIVERNAEEVVSNKVNTIYDLGRKPTIIQWEVTDYITGCTQEIKDKLVNIIKLGRQTGICLVIKCKSREKLSWLLTEHHALYFNEISIISNTGAVFAVQAKNGC